MTRLPRNILALAVLLAVAGCASQRPPKANGVTTASQYVTQHADNDKAMATILDDLEKRTR